MQFHEEKKEMLYFSVVSTIFLLKNILPLVKEFSNICCMFGQILIVYPIERKVGKHFTKNIAQSWDILCCFLTFLKAKTNNTIFNNQDTFLSSYNKSTLFSSFSSSSWEFTQTMSTSIDSYPLFVQHFTNYVEYILLEFLNSKQLAKGYERMLQEILRKSGYFIIK